VRADRVGLLEPPRESAPRVVLAVAERTEHLMERFPSQTALIRSTCGVFMRPRKPTPDELRLFRELATIAGIEEPDAWAEALIVEEMDDGGMGSLAIVTPHSDQTRPGVIRCRAAVQFTDADGVEVIASLNANAGKVPLELDIWKTDFSKLIRIADEFRRVRE
jgi:hypothetical protein